MKKLITCSPTILVILFSFVPLCALIALCGRYTLELRFGNEMILLESIFAIVILLNLSDYPIPMDPTNVILGTLAFPLSLLNGFLFIDNCRTFSSVVLALVCCACAAFLLYRTRKSPQAATRCRGIAVVMCVFLLLFGCLTCLSGSTAVASSAVISSPSGDYVATLLEYPQTNLVEVNRPGRDVDLLLFCFSDRPLSVVLEKSEKEPSVFFQNEHILIINDTAYDLSNYF